MAEAGAAGTSNLYKGSSQKVKYSWARWRCYWYREGGSRSGNVGRSIEGLERVNFKLERVRLDSSRPAREEPAKTF